MNYSQYKWYLLLRIFALLATLSLLSWLFIQGSFSLAIPVILLAVYQTFDLFRFTNKSNEELSQFLESVQYKDFSRRFDENNAPISLKPWRRGFNQINNTFKNISREREEQFIYLQKILELVDTGILAYQVPDGQILWMNETLKTLLDIPYLKTIHSLQTRNAALYEELIQLEAGKVKVIQITQAATTSKIQVSATVFRSTKKMFKLIAFQNIHVALDENETLAWKKLLSVMTHEIVNSVAPISSLAETMKNRLNNREPGEKQDDALFNDLELGIETIERRSKGLQKFAETYRALNKIATPDLQKVYLRDIFENIYRLMQPTFDHKGIQFEMILKETSLYIEVDMHLIEQVLINLIVNAIEAVKESPQPTIRMYAYSNSREKAIRITDNGSGMPEEILEKIFIPFFTTRKNGSGIGLSLCKQIMLLHQGKINARSRVGEGTAMTLVFI